MPVSSPPLVPDPVAAPRLLTPVATAELLEISIRSLYRLRDENANFPEPVYVLRSRPRWKENEIVDYLNSL